MISWLRIAILSSVLLAPAIEVAAQAGGTDPAAHPAGKAGPSDKVYRYRGSNGREVFTNAGAVMVKGQAVEAMKLPALNADLDKVSPQQLQLLDNSVQRAHDELQQGSRCQAIRASLRVPVTGFVWREHLRELCVGVALLALAVAMLGAWRGRLRGLMPVAPLLGSLYLGYATFARVEHRLGTLREGLRACSSDLPPQSGDVSSVNDRLQSAVSLQATIDRAYAERARLADSIMRER